MSVETATRPSEIPPSIALITITKLVNEKWQPYQFSEQLVSNPPIEPSVRILNPEEVSQVLNPVVPQKSETPVKNPSQLDENGTIQTSAKNIDLAPNLGVDPDFEDTGFNLEREMTNLFTQRNYYGLDANMRTFTIEFIEASSVFPNLVAMEGSDMVNSYDHQRIVPKISSSERDGSYVKASELIEGYFAPNNRLNTLKERRMGIINSPPGWNGLGEDYSDAQTVVFWEEEDGQFKGLTLRTDMTFEQSRQLSINLGVDKEKLTGSTRREEIANLVKNPVLLELGSERFNGIESIFTEIIAIRGNKDIEVEQRDGTKLKIPVADMLADIRRRNELLNFSQAVEAHLGELKAFVLERADQFADFSTQYAITEKVKETIYEITNSVMEEDGLVESGSIPSSLNLSGYLIFNSKNINSYPAGAGEKYQAAKLLLKNRVGCSKGIKGSSSSSGSFGQALGSLAGTSSVGASSALDSDLYGSLEYECGKCNQTNRRTPGILDTSCGKCGANVAC